MGPALGGCWLNDPGGRVQRELRRGDWGCRGPTVCVGRSGTARSTMRTVGVGSVLRGKVAGKQERGPRREVRVEEREGQRCPRDGGQGSPWIWGAECCGCTGTYVHLG